MYTIISSSNVCSDAASSGKTSLVTEKQVVGNTSKDHLCVVGSTRLFYDAKKMLRYAARSAFKEATKHHLALNQLDFAHIPILDFDTYGLITKNPSEPVFLADHALVIANAEGTSIELLKYVEVHEWKIYKYVLRKEAIVLRLFEIQLSDPSMHDAKDHLAAGASDHDAMFAIPAPPPICGMTASGRTTHRDGHNNRASWAHAHQQQKDQDGYSRSNSTWFPNHGAAGSEESTLPGGRRDCYGGRALLPANIDADLRQRLAQRRQALENSAIEQTFAFVLAAPDQNEVDGTTAPAETQETSSDHGVIPSLIDQDWEMDGARVDSADHNVAPDQQ